MIAHAGPKCRPDDGPIETQNLPFGRETGCRPLRRSDPKPEWATRSQGVQIFDNVVKRCGLLLRLFGHPIDLLEGRDPTDDLEHPVGVKR